LVFQTNILKIINNIILCNIVDSSPHLKFVKKKKKSTLKGKFQNFKHQLLNSGLCPQLKYSML
jgi:hypothetical protein